MGTRISSTDRNKTPLNEIGSGLAQQLAPSVQPIQSNAHLSVTNILADEGNTNIRSSSTASTIPFCNPPGCVTPVFLYFLFNFFHIPGRYEAPRAGY